MRSEGESQAIEVARGNHGMISKRRLRELGIAAGTVRRRIEDGLWTAPLPGVICVDGATDRFIQQVAAATTYSGQGGVASHRTSALLWGVGGFRSTPIEVSTLSRRVDSTLQVIVHRPALLPDEDLTLVKGVPATMPARMLHEIAGVADPKRTWRAAMDCLDRDLVTEAELEQRLIKYGKSGRNGTTILRRVIAALDTGAERTDSHLEDELIPLLRTNGFPPFVRNYVVSERGIHVAEVDVIWPELKVIVEADGFEFHGSKAAFFRDRRKQNQLMALGYRVLRFTWEDKEHPAAFLKDLRRTLAVAGG
ncbi:MAG: DUF559 domain-containing protein [Actinobacteria bacterium]|jgi:very-short-patch-repair endonuclease|nr:DUF559 domain-containing protein [Actinomycetota bacterium]